MTGGKSMDRNYFEEYAQIVGQTKLETYKSPEDEANKIKKCTILKSVDISYSYNVVGYNTGASQYMTV